MRKIFLTIAGFYFLVLLQISFFPHFFSVDLYKYFVGVAVVIVALFEKPWDITGYAAALSGGFFEDIFSKGFIGINILIFLTLVFAIKFTFRRYVRFPSISTI